MKHRFLSVLLQQSRAKLLGSICVLAIVFAAILYQRTPGNTRAQAMPPPENPVLTVTATSTSTEIMPITILANGNVMAWEEASIGSEADGQRLIKILANVGDTVKRGQVLAVFESNAVNAELAQSRAVVAENRAALAEAQVNARSARELKTTGAISAQQIRQYVTAEQSMHARLNAALAFEKIQRLRVEKTQVLAPDNGVISARSATVGAVLPSGQELFRLVRFGRLEWRAEVPASELAKLRPGQVTRVTPVGGEAISGVVRVVAPTVNLQTGNGLVYVDLPDGSVRAGMFARGEFEIDTRLTLTLPQSAIIQRDGFDYVVLIDQNSRAVLNKVIVGKRLRDRIEVQSGIVASAKVVNSGGSFIGDGDLLRVLDALPDTPSAPSEAPPQSSADSNVERRDHEI